MKIDTRKTTSFRDTAHCRIQKNPLVNDEQEAHPIVPGSHSEGTPSLVGRTLRYETTILASPVLVSERLSTDGVVDNHHGSNTCSSLSNASASSSCGKNQRALLTPDSLEDLGLQLELLCLDNQNDDDEDDDERESTSPTSSEQEEEESDEDEATIPNTHLRTTNHHRRHEEQGSSVTAAGSYSTYVATYANEHHRILKVRRSLRVRQSLEDQQQPPSEGYLTRVRSE